MNKKSRIRAEIYELPAHSDERVFALSVIFKGSKVHVYYIICKEESRLFGLSRDYDVTFRKKVFGSVKGFKERKASPKWKQLKEDLPKTMKKRILEELEHTKYFDTIIKPKLKNIDQKNFN